MKFIYFLAASMLIFVSCEKEDTTDQNNNNNNNNNTPSFTCEIGGNDFTNNTPPTININESNMMSIDVSDGTYDISLRIYEFDTKTEGEVIYFSSPSMGSVTIGEVTYSSTGFGSPPNYDGQLLFSKKESDKISGTFNFKAQNVAVGQWDEITVKDGAFEDIVY